MDLTPIEIIRFLQIYSDSIHQPLDDLLMALLDGNVQGRLSIRISTFQVDSVSILKDFSGPKISRIDGFDEKLQCLCV